MITFELLSKELLAAIIDADTKSALSLIFNYRSAFLDPPEGLYLHAEALFAAIRKNDLQVVNALLDLGVYSDVAFFKLCGSTPISLALEEGHLELMPVLLAKTDKNFALDLAVRLHLERSQQYLLNHCQFKKQFLHYLGLVDKPEHAVI